MVNRKLIGLNLKRHVLIVMALIKETQRQTGSILIRYGSEIGHYTAPKGTDYDKLALPYKQETIEYNEYQVTHSEGINVCEVYKGRVAPAFDSEGGAIQYYHPITIRESVRKGILKRIDL